MVEIKFWNIADECIQVNGLYIHRVNEKATQIYIQAIGREAIEDGATSVTIDTDDEMKDFYIDIDEKGHIHLELNFVDTYITIEDDYASNMHCDTYGTCGGRSCPQYMACHS
ncbi:MAG: hypothetical protein II453_01105 [Alphaproteobacteria bacterium]|nr:hypothetical protein [Alphaproteobacteria bacterium]MBQ3943115.1 hypothetical protein [Elusimicrobiota bacterium]